MIPQRITFITLGARDVPRMRTLGYSGYLADPEGNRWEIGWLPGLDVD